MLLLGQSPFCATAAVGTVIHALAPTEIKKPEPTPPPAAQKTSQNNFKKPSLFSKVVSLSKKGAQIAKKVHLSGGVGIGGVLEPLQAAPVIIEDGAFIGSRSIVVEGVRIRKGAVLGANVVLTKSTRIIDVTGEKPVTYRGEVPERSVVIPGSYAKEFPSGTYNVPAALIIGQRKESTDLKTSLNDALREFNVAV
jgi:2,3,4,5-tetrahydropyridine-2,6-dicarboxylate N-succinyltransferase